MIDRGMAIVVLVFLLYIPLMLVVGGLLSLPARRHKPAPRPPVTYDQALAATRPMRDEEVA